MTMQPPLESDLSVRFDWPPAPEHAFHETVFVGVWHPERALQVRCSEPPPGMATALVTGRNWALLSSALPGEGAGLVHAGDPGAGEPEGLAFRGYVLEPPLSCWGDGAAILRYWSADRGRHNGVFSTALIDRAGSRLRLVTDAFGMAPLFVRRLRDGTVLFATSPRYLVLPGDEPDPIAARTLFQRGSLCGNISLVPDVRRLSPGRCLRFTSEEVREETWFDLEGLPRGEVPLDDRALTDIEDAFQAAVDRCLRLLPAGPVHLPLSSGDDSRRILAALIHRRVAFQARTVRFLQQGNRDLDARFATALARHFGFPHRVLEPSDPEQYRLDNRDCRLLFSSEINEHTWIVPLIKSIGPGRSLLFDGLAGDIFGNTGFEVAELHTLDEERKLAALLEHSIPTAGSKVLRERAWPSLGEARAVLERFFRSLPEGKNRADLAFLFIRAGRGTVLWSHHLLPVGCLPVFPYLDLDHAVASLRCDPLDRLREFVPARCLARFWPEYYAFPGSRRVPPGIPAERPEQNQRRRLACLAQLRAECGAGLWARLADRVKARSWVLAVASTLSQRLRLRLQWWLSPLLMIESHRAWMRACWHTQATASVPTRGLVRGPFSLVGGNRWTTDVKPPGVR